MLWQVIFNLFCKITEILKGISKLDIPFKISGRRGSNSQHSAWKADTLPIELHPHKFI